MRAALVLVAVLVGCSGDPTMAVVLRGATWEPDQSIDWDMQVRATVYEYGPSTVDGFSGPLAGSGQTSAVAARFFDGSVAWSDERIALPLVAEDATLVILVRDELTDRGLVSCRVALVAGLSVSEDPVCTEIDFSLE